MSVIVVDSIKPTFYKRNFVDALDTYDYTIEIVNFEEIKENSVNWIKDTCTVHGETVLDLEKRNSYRYSIKYEVNLPADVRSVLNALNLLNPQSSGEFLAYNTGCKFTKHKDRKKDTSVRYEHTHNLLIIFPTEYTGGDLVIHDERINNANSSTYKYVIFDINCYHEAEEVTSGEKYVYKVPIFSQNQSYHYEEDDELCD